MILPRSTRLWLCDILRQLTDAEDILECTAALMEAQGYRSLVKAAAKGHGEESYLKTLRQAMRGRVGSQIPTEETVLYGFEVLVSEMEGNVEMGVRFEN